jgi:hypothetical protein
MANLYEAICMNRIYLQVPYIWVHGPHVPMGQYIPYIHHIVYVYI